jgi:hypothetical protein
VHRLQVPATPDPYDDATSDADRQAVLALLPPRTAPADAEGMAADGIEAEVVETEVVETEPIAAKAVAAETT